MVRFESVGLTVSIMTFVDVSFCVTLNSLPAPSYAVMLNAASPFCEFSKTVTQANLNSSNLTIDKNIPSLIQT